VSLSNHPKQEIAVLATVLAESPYRSGNYRCPILLASRSLSDLVDALPSTLVDFVGDVPDVALGEFVHHLERLDFLLDGLSRNLTPVNSTTSGIALVQ